MEFVSLGLSHRAGRPLLLSECWMSKDGSCRGSGLNCSAVLKGLGAAVSWAVLLNLAHLGLVMSTCLLCCNCQGLSQMGPYYSRAGNVGWLG